MRLTPCGTTADRASGMTRTYLDLMKIKTFKERFEYLKLNGKIGEETFGFDRYINQIFYKSREWKALRDFVIIRDSGCDLGMEGYEIGGKIIIHHMNPISLDDIKTRSEFLLNPDYLICVSHTTHNAIHYGNDELLAQEPVERRKNDTCLWRD